MSVAISVSTPHNVVRSNPPQFDAFHQLSKNSAVIRLCPVSACAIFMSRSRAAFCRPEIVVPMRNLHLETSNKARTPEALFAVNSFLFQLRPSAREIRDNAKLLDRIIRHSQTQSFDQRFALGCHFSV